jgi:hypothetical protein
VISKGMILGQRTDPGDFSPDSVPPLCQLITDLLSDPVIYGHAELDWAIVQRQPCRQWGLPPTHRVTQELQSGINEGDACHDDYLQFAPSLLAAAAAAAAELVGGQILRWAAIEMSNLQCYALLLIGLWNPSRCMGCWIGKTGKETRQYFVRWKKTSEEKHLQNFRVEQLKCAIKSLTYFEF